MSRRSVSPLLRQQLHTLEKDADSCSSAIRVLKPFVEGLDFQTIPRFISQVYQNREPNFSNTTECTISLYEVLARLHGAKIVPQIENIMSTIVNTLISSAGSFPLQQACSKVISAVAIHGIEPTMPGNEKSEIIGSLCQPLSDVLMGSPESAASGSALCLKALVDCENWSFATNELVNDVCLKVAGALEGSETQTNFHMALAISLASRNGLLLEAYARSIIRSGIRILESSSLEVKLHKRLTSIQMIVCIMKCIDSRSFSSEVENILDVMEIFSLDPMECVRKAAFEASRTAKRICFLKDSSSVTRSNFSKRASRQNQSFCWVRGASGKNYSNGSPACDTPQSYTLNSATDLHLFEHSPIPSVQGSCNIGYRCSSRRKLWGGNGGADELTEDGLYSKVQGSPMHLEVGEESEGEREGSSRCSRMLGTLDGASATPSPERVFLRNNMDANYTVTAPKRQIDFILNRATQCPDFHGEKVTESRCTSSMCIRHEKSCDEDDGGCAFNIKHDDQIEEQNLQHISSSVQEAPQIPCNQLKVVASSEEKARQSTAFRKGIVVLVIVLCLVFAAFKLELEIDEEIFDAYPT